MPKCRLKRQAKMCHESDTIGPLPGGTNTANHDIPTVDINTIASRVTAMPGIRNKFWREDI